MFYVSILYIQLKGNYRNLYIIDNNSAVFVKIKLQNVLRFNNNNKGTIYVHRNKNINT